MTNDELRIAVDFRLYLITDRKQLKEGRMLISAVRSALKGGVRAVQLREKDMETRDLLKLAYKMRNLTADFSAKLFINDRLDIALAVGADGVHLTRNSMPVEAVRAVVKNKLLIGVSTHSLNEAIEAEKGGADFITFGPVYRTASKLKYGRPAGLEQLRKTCSGINLPVFALGGIKARRIENVMKMGACGISIISEILTAENIQKKTVAINALLH